MMPFNAVAAAARRINGARLADRSETAGSASEISDRGHGWWQRPWLGVERLGTSLKYVMTKNGLFLV